MGVGGERGFHLLHVESKVEILVNQSKIKTKYESKCGNLEVNRKRPQFVGKSGRNRGQDIVGFLVVVAENFKVLK